MEEEKEEVESFARSFVEQHGPSVCATAFPVVIGAATRIDAEANMASLTRRMFGASL